MEKSHSQNFRNFLNYLKQYPTAASSQVPSKELQLEARTDFWKIVFERNEFEVRKTSCQYYYKDESRETLDLRVLNNYEKTFLSSKYRISTFETYYLDIF